MLHRISVLSPLFPRNRRPQCKIDSTLIVSALAGWGDPFNLVGMFDIYAMPGHLLRRLHQISTALFADRMRTLGHEITAPQFATLSVLRNVPGVDQATLAGMVAHDRPTLGGVIERLEAKGLVARAQNPSDRRAKVLALTPSGEALLDVLIPEVEALQAQILPGLTDGERAQFVTLAQKVAIAGNAAARAPLVVPKAAVPTD